MKKLLTAIASTVVLSLGFAPTVRAFPFSFPQPPAPASIFPAPPAPPAPASIFPAPPPPPLPAPPAPPAPPSLLTPPAQISQSTDVKWCRITNPVGATLALSNSAKTCVASNPGEAFGRLAAFTMGDPSPAIQAATCLKNNHPQDYNKALEFIEITSDCKIYGD